MTKDVESLLKKAEEKVETKEFSEALKYLDKVFTVLEDYGPAEAIIDKILELEPDNADALFIKGRIFVINGENLKALAYLDNVLKIDPDNVKCLIIKGYALVELEKYEKAIDCFNCALTIDENNSDALSGKGLALASEGHYPAAIQCFDKALEIDPENTEILYWKSLTLWDYGKIIEAMDVVEAGLNIDPNDYLLLQTKGRLLRKSKKLDEALKIFEHILKLYPDDADVWFDIGTVYQDMDKIQDSVTAYEKFIQVVRENKISELSTKANRVTEYIKWYKKTGGRVTIKPREKPHFWQWITQSEFFLESDCSERKDLEPGSSIEPDRWWTCHKDTRAGDLALLYRAGKKCGKRFMDIKYLLMARGDAFPLDDIEDAVEDGWKYGCNFIPIYKFKNSLTLDEMRKNPNLKGWNALNAKFIGSVYKTEEDYWKILRNIFIEKNPDFGEFWKNFDRNEIIDKIITRNEVIDKLEANINILKQFGHDLEVKNLNVLITDGGVIDLLCIDKTEGNYVVIELKVDKANMKTFGQISSYMGWVMDHKPADKPVKGIVISRGYDKRFKSSLNINPNIKHIELRDILLELDMKLV
ncbi:MAG: endonuclease NucS domain-containing protein [Methanobacterium sp.]